MGNARRDGWETERVFHRNIFFDQQEKIVETETDTERKIRVTAIGSESTYVSELVVEQEVLGALADLVFLPTDELGLERLEHGGGRARAVDEHQAETARRMLQAEAGEHVGTDKLKAMKGKLRLMRE